VDASSSAVCSIAAGLVTWSAAGSCKIDYASGAANGYTSSSTSETFTVHKATTKTALKLSAVKVIYGHEQAGQLSVTVSPQYPGKTPTGRVTVKTSTGALCAITLSSGKGSCTLSAKRLKVGTYHLFATYGGSTRFDGSTSATKTLTVVQ
jgi:hypothetical protein